MTESTGETPAEIAVRTVWQRRRPDAVARIEILEEATAALIEGRLDDELRRAGEEAAHKLSGSLGSFGYPRGSELAFLAEAILGGDAEVQKEDALKLAEWIDEMWTEIEHPPGTSDATVKPAEPELVDTGKASPDVVVVEDDSILAELLLHGLRNAGYQPEWFDDGGKAVEALTGADARLFPKVLLLDVDLPAVSGIGVLRAMAETGALERTRVIMLTAHASEEETVKTFELGAFDHVAKPFSLPVLLQRLRRALED